MTTISSTTQSILIIDDVPDNIKILLRILKDDYELHYATSGEQALSLMSAVKKPDLILLDVMMPEMDGYELCTALKQDVATSTIPVIFITAKLDAESEARALSLGAVDFIHKPINRDVVRARVRLHLDMNQRANELLLANTELTEWITILKSRVLQQTALVRKKVSEVHQQHDRRQNSSDDLVLVFADLMSQRDQRLSKHSHNVVSLAQSMAKTLGLPTTQIDEIRHAALLHDVGLIGLPDRLLASSMEMLSGDDATNYRSHPVRGQKTIESFDELKGIGLHIRNHHEAYDGSGFPDGLAGKDISVGGKIIHLASFIENSFSRFHGQNEKYKISNKVAAGMGTLFDPALSTAANVALKEVTILPTATHRGHAK